MTKKQTIAGGAATMLLLASATLALAQTSSTTTTATTTTTTTATTTTPTPTPTPVPAPAPVPVPPPRKNVKNTVQIGPEGNALIRGTVSAVGANSITISSWGGSWTINVATDTRVMPKSTSTPLALISQGDFVGVNGKIDTTQPWTVNARLIRDTDAEHRAITLQKQMRMRLKEAESQAREKIKQMRKTSQEEIKDLRKKEQEERKKLRDQ